MSHSGGQNDDARIEAEVQRLLDEQINPALQSHGGFANLVRVEAGRVYLELGGGCRGCPGARMTMQRGIEVFLRERVPGIVSVVDATDHRG
jgi:Fe/S biogenesis protein NfuA